MTTTGLTRRNVSRSIRPESLATDYAYGPVRILTPEGALVRIITPAELAARHVVDVRDTDALLPIHTARKPKRHRGKQVPRYNVPRRGEWINYVDVRPERTPGRAWD